MSATALNMGLIKSDVQQETHRGSATGDERRCWKDLEEIENPDTAGRKTPVLPEFFWNERIKVPAVRIKLCIDHQGKVVRSVLLNSSGNTKVDHYYLVEWSKATFKPIERNRKPVPSVFTVSTRWNPR